MIQFRTYNLSPGQSIEIVKCGLDDPNIHQNTKVLAIQNVLETATHNSVSKQDLLNALRWLYDQYEFEI